MSKKILMISGSPKKKGDGAKILKELETLFVENSDIECEYLFLKDYKIEMCIGCLACQKREGEKCPIKDDMLLIKEKLNQADGFVFISPVYIRMISAQMKLLFDRLSFMLHRPVLGGKPAILLCTASFKGTKQSLDYLKIPVRNMGIHIVDSVGVLSNAYKNKPEYKNKIIDKLKTSSKKFTDILFLKEKPRPSAADILVFNKWKYKAIHHKKQYPGDFLFWETNELLDKDYFYPTKINPIFKILIPAIVNFVLKRTSKKIGYL